MRFYDHPNVPKNGDLHYQWPHDEHAVAYLLYDKLREADQSKSDIIVVELPPHAPTWHAIRDKLFKAGEALDSMPCIST